MLRVLAIGVGLPPGALGCRGGRRADAAFQATILLSKELHLLLECLLFSLQITVLILQLLIVLAQCSKFIFELLDVDFYLRLSDHLETIVRASTYPCAF